MNGSSRLNVQRTHLFAGHGRGVQDRVAYRAISGTKAVEQSCVSGYFKNDQGHMSPLIDCVHCRYRPHHPLTASLSTLDAYPPEQRQPLSKYMSGGEQRRRNRPLPLRPRVN